MQRAALSACLVLLLAAGFTSATSHSHKRADAVRAAVELTRLQGSPATVPQLNVTQYLGRWYEVYQDLLTAITFQQDSYCAIAEYGVDATNAAHVTVFNWEHHGSETGPIVNVTGYAYQPNPTTAPGQLVVYLHGDNASPFPAPYWVLALGPVVNGVYDYAVVSDSLRLTLFVLTRDVTRFDAQYKDTVLSFLASNGFDKFWNKPVRLPQLGNCTYP